MNKKLELNFTKKPEMVFQFDQFLNVEQAVDKFLNKKENLERLIAPLIPTNLEETIQKLIPEVEDGKTPIKGIDYDDGKDGETPSDEKIISLIEPLIPEPIPGNDGKTPKKGVDYFTKKELEDIKKGLKEAIMSEMTNHVTKEEVNIKLEEIKKQVNSLQQSGGAQFLRQLMDVNVGVPTAQQYGLTYNPSRSEFTLTAITGGGAVDSVNGQTGVVVLDADDISDTSTTKKFTTTTEKNTWNAKQDALTADVDYLTPGTAGTTYEPKKGTDDNYVTDAEKIVIGNTSGTNTGDNATNSQYSGLASSKQDTLVSGTNIKTINSTSILGSGNIDISGGSGNGAIMSRGYSNNASFSEGTIFADFQGVSASSDEAGDIIPFSGTIKNLFIAVLGNAHSSTSSYTLAINGTATTVTVSYSSEETGNKSDTTHTASISAGDRVTVKAIGDGTGDIYFSFSYSVV